MTKFTKAPYVAEVADRPVIGTLRIARVTYLHETLHSGGQATIGETIDAHIAGVLSDGGMIAEVSLFFETQEQQHAVAAMYGRPL